MIASQWTSLYQAIDELGHTVDFALTAKRDVPVARRLLNTRLA